MSSRKKEKDGASENEMDKLETNDENFEKLKAQIRKLKDENARLEKSVARWKLYSQVCIVLEGTISKVCFREVEIRHQAIEEQPLQV